MAHPDGALGGWTRALVGFWAVWSVPARLRVSAPAHTYSSAGSTVMSEYWRRLEAVGFEAILPRIQGPLSQLARLLLVEASSYSGV